MECLTQPSSLVWGLYCYFINVETEEALRSAVTHLASHGQEVEELGFELGQSATHTL